MMKDFPAMIALSDIAAAVRKYRLVGMLGWQDVRQRYQRSVLGPFWLTISMAVMIATMGLVFGQILNLPFSDFLPFLTAGIIIWGFISTTINEGCGAIHLGRSNHQAAANPTVRTRHAYHLAQYHYCAAQHRYSACGLYRRWEAH